MLKLRNPHPPPMSNKICDILWQYATTSLGGQAGCKLCFFFVFYLFKAKIVLHQHRLPTPLYSDTSTHRWQNASSLHFSCWHLAQKLRYCSPICVASGRACRQRVNGKWAQAYFAPTVLPTTQKLRNSKQVLFFILFFFLAITLLKLLLGHNKSLWSFASCPAYFKCSSSSTVSMQMKVLELDEEIIDPFTGIRCAGAQDGKTCRVGGSSQGLGEDSEVMGFGNKMIFY